MEKRSFSENISGIRENIRLYIETKLSLYTLIVFDKAVKALTVFISNTTVLLLLALSVIFFSAAAAIFIGRLLESPELGLLIVGGIYLFLGFVFFIFRKPIFSRMVLSYLVSIFFKDDDDDISEPPTR